MKSDIVIYSEKATNFCEISTVDLFYVVTDKSGRDFAKSCGLLRMYEVYKSNQQR